MVGLAARFPGARDVEELWRALAEGRETTSFFAPEEIDPRVPEERRLDPAYVRARGVLEGAELFDAAFFGITPKEAQLMDPQHRLFLRDEALLRQLDRGAHRGLGRALGVARLQDPQLAVLDGELDVLRVAEVLLEALAVLRELGRDLLENGRADA